MTTKNNVEIFFHENCNGELRVEFNVIPIVRCMKCKTQWDLIDPQKITSYTDLKFKKEDEK